MMKYSRLWQPFNKDKVGDFHLSENKSSLGGDQLQQ